MYLQSHLATFDLKNKRVLLRADLNVPLHNGAILGDHRLQALIPTLNLILKKGGAITLLTHIGRPTHHDPQLSTRHLIPWFKDHGYSIDYVSDINQLATHIPTTKTTITLFENLRFFTEETSHNQIFAQHLADCGDYFVNDAFATLHRNDTSITLLPTLFSSEKRTIGLLIERELVALESLINKPKKPFVLIVGGGKIASKLPLIENMLPHISHLVLGPALVFTFLRALGHNVGKSLIDENSINHCTKIIAHAKKHTVTIVFPVDYQVAYQTIDGSLSYISADNFQNHDLGISIGSQTIKELRPLIAQAKTIFVNGLMGFAHKKETLTGMQALFKEITDSTATRIIGGGETATVAYLYGFQNSFDHISTGGGATLAYLNNKKLPGLKPFLPK